MTHLQNHFTRVDDFDVGLSSDGHASQFLRSAVHGGLCHDLVVVAVGLAGAVRKLRWGCMDKDRCLNCIKSSSFLLLSSGKVSNYYRL